MIQLSLKDSVKLCDNDKDINMLISSQMKAQARMILGDKSLDELDYGTKVVTMLQI